MEWKELQERVASYIYNEIRNCSVKRIISLFIVGVWILCMNILIWHLIAPSWLRWIDSDDLGSIGFMLFVGGMYLVIRYTD